jgi:hypothetical protein
VSKESLSPDDGAASEPVIKHESIAEVKAERVLLARAIGGWSGVIDSGLPSAVFVTAYVVSGSQLTIALWAAGISAGVLAIIRLIRRQGLQQVLAGLVGVGVSAYVAQRTGNAEDFYLPGMLLNVTYGVAFLISILVGWPLIGVVVGFLTGEKFTWRADVVLRRSYAAVSWIWVGVFLGRVLVQGLLYLAVKEWGQDTLWFVFLGIARIALGWPLYLAAAYVTYLVLKGPIAAARNRREST